MTLAVVWLPEAEADVREAWVRYDSVRPALSERFARAVSATLEAVAKNPLRFPVVHKIAGEQEYGGFLTG